MIRYHKYKIKETDRFDPLDFPKVEAELEDMIKAAAGVPATNKEPIIIAWLKDHALEKELTDSNPALAQLLQDGHFVTTNMEALFESCQANKNFRMDFEGFIKESLAQGTAQNAGQQV